MIEVLPGRFQFLYALHPLVEPKLFRELDEALIGREGFEHGAGFSSCLRERWRVFACA